MATRPRFLLDPNRKYFYNRYPQYVYITNIVSPHKFFVIKMLNLPGYKKLVEEMNIEFNRDESIILYEGTVYSPERGPVYAVNLETARSNPEKRWERCVVTEIIEDGWLGVKMPDTGYEDVVRWNALRYLSSKHTKFDALAKECHLARQIPFNKTWSDGAIDLLKKYAGCLMVARVENAGRPADSVGERSVPLILYEKSDSNNMFCINDEMLRRKYAYTLGVYTFYKTPNDEDWVNYLPPDVSAEHFSPRRLEVEILHCQSPSLIYVSLLNQQKKNKVMLNKMQNYYLKSNESEPEEEWKVGDRCSVLTPYSVKWRRVQIMEIINDDAKVFYIDTAWIDTVPKSCLFVLPSKFSMIDDGAIKCHLYGIMPGDGKNWPLTTIEYLKEMIRVYKKLNISIMGELKDGSMPIQLWVYHTMGDICDLPISTWRSLNQKLLLKGLCIPDQL